MCLFLGRQALASLLEMSYMLLDEGFQGRGLARRERRCREAMEEGVQEPLGGLLFSTPQGQLTCSLQLGPAEKAGGDRMALLIQLGQGVLEHVAKTEVGRHLVPATGYLKGLLMGVS